MLRILFAAVTFLVMAGTAVAQGNITVTGSATSFNLPNKAKITVYVSKLEKAADDVFDETADAVEDIVQEMQEQGYVTEINVSDMRIEPVYDRVNMRYGFRSYQEISFSIDSLEAYEEALDEVLGSGADGIAKASTMSEDQGTVDMELMKQAVRNARAKAESLAEAENQQIGKVISIEVLEAEDDAASNITVDKTKKYSGLSQNQRVNVARVRVTFALN